MKLSFPEAEVTRSLYRNLYKAGWVVVDEDALVIDSNELVTKRMEKAAKAGRSSGGFVSGLDAERVEVAPNLEEEEALRQAALEEQAALEKEIGRAHV